MSLARALATSARHLLDTEEVDVVLVRLCGTLAEALPSPYVVVSADDLEGPVRRRVSDHGTAHAALEPVWRSTVPTRMPGRVTVTVHAHDGDELTTPQQEHADLLVELAGLALDNAHTIAQFREAVQARDVIGQAKGRISERFGLDDKQAFALLRRLSQEQHLRLRVVAQQVLTGELLIAQQG